MLNSGSLKEQRQRSPLAQPRLPRCLGYSRPQDGDRGLGSRASSAPDLVPRILNFSASAAHSTPPHFQEGVCREMLNGSLGLLGAGATRSKDLRRQNGRNGRWAGVLSEQELGEQGS